MAVTSSTGTGATEGQVAGWLTPAEFSIIETVCDTFFPSLEPPAGSSEVVAAYYRRKASDLHVPMLVAESLGKENAEARDEFRQLLSLMGKRVTGLLLVGSAKPFIDLKQKQREKYLQIGRAH